MGKRGPRTKPIETHLADGTYRADRHGESSVVLAERVTGVETLPAPSYLPDGAQEVWLGIVTVLAPSGILQAADALALEAMALSVWTWREAQRDIETNGILVMGRFETEVANPAIAVRDKSMAEFRSWAGRFGLTPSDRTELGLQLVKGISARETLEDAIGPDPRFGGDDDFE